MLTRARGGCVVHRCQNKNPIERLTSGCEWRHAPEARAWRILGILKKSVSWVETRHRTRRVDFRGSQRPDEFARYRRRTRWWGIERMCISLRYVEETLNSKVIKSFVPGLRSRKCFSCFEIPMFHVYMLRTLWRFCAPVWICPFHVYVSGYGITWQTEQQFMGNINEQNKHIYGDFIWQNREISHENFGHGYERWKPKDKKWISSNSSTN